MEQIIQQQLQRIQICYKYEQMSKQCVTNRSSLRENRQHLRVERLIKFIQSNNIAVNYQRSDLNSNNHIYARLSDLGLECPIQQNLNQQESEYIRGARINVRDTKSNQLSKKAKQNYKKIILNEAINKFVSKQIGIINNQQQNTRGISLQHLNKRQNRQKAKSKDQEKTRNKGLSSVQKEQNLFPIIKTVKTQETPIKDLKSKSELMSKILQSKKYQSSLLLPKHISSRNSYTNNVSGRNELDQREMWKDQIQNHCTTKQKQAKKSQLRKKINELIGKQRFRQSRLNLCTGWQTNNDQIKQFQYDNWN